MTTTNRPIKRALVSVFHKEGIEVLAKAFIEAGTEVVSTGSTAHRLAELGVPVIEVSEVTGFPESLDGRVKTLDPHIHAGILADMTNPDHAAQLEQLGIKPFDLVVVNLYPFADTVRSGADEAATIEKIDIGGPSMVRGAAKNSATVAIVTDSGGLRPGRRPCGRRHRLLVGGAPLACGQGVRAHRGIRCHHQRVDRQALAEAGQRRHRAGR